MKRLSLQWRITLMTVLLIGITCVAMNLLLCSSGVYYMDTIADSLQGGGTVILNDGGAASFDPQLIAPNEELTIVVDGVQGRFRTTNWYITAAVTLLSGILAYFVSGRALKPLRSFTSQVEQVQLNNLADMRIDEDAISEFRQLSRSFNQMLERIQKLISQIYEEQKKLKNSELKALQAQIQPHFLYNSLDSVMWLLRMDKNRDAEKMLNELSTLFKISLSKGNEIITIEEELRHISSYLFITNMIYSKKFEYAIECDPVLYSYRTLKLLLQPLAENAIAHAIPMPGQKVFIQVRIYEDEDSLVLSVQDISRGIDQETLEKLQQQLGTAAHPDRRDSGYGLYNVNERIHILFGSSYGLTVTSEPDFGTEVTVRIPKLKGDDIFVPGNAL